VLPCRHDTPSRWLVPLRKRALPMGRRSRESSSARHGRVDAAGRSRLERLGSRAYDEWQHRRANSCSAGMEARMKRLLLFSCLATLATGSVRAQHEHHEMMHKTAAGVQLEVTNDTASHVLLLRVGPLDLPAHSGHMAVAQAPQQFWVVP